MERSYFDGTVLEHFGYSLLAVLFTAITCGFGAPWAYCGFHRWETSHTVIDSKRLEFDGEGLELFLMSIKFAFFVIITLGIYGVWVPVRLSQWVVSHTHFKSSTLPDTPESEQSPRPAGHLSPAPHQDTYQRAEKDWVDKITPVLPLVYVLWFCGIAFAVFFLLRLIF